MLRSAQPMLAATLYPAAGLLAVVFGFELHRLGDEDVHDVDDYKPTPDVPPVVRPRRRLRPAPSQTPIADEVAGLPMSDETAHRIARRWLVDIAAVQQAKAGIRPAYATAERDMTGAFPVVAVAR